MPEVTVGDARVVYDMEGAGEPVVLLHGTTQDRTGWATLAPALTGSYRVITPDLPGSGQTTDGGGPLDLDEVVGLVIAVADDAGLDAFHLGGYSLGAVVAAAVAAEAGERVQSLTLLCGWAVSDAHIRFELDLWRRLLETDIDLFLRHAFSHGFTDAWFDVVGDAAGMVVEAATALVNGPGAARQAELDTRIDIDGRLGRITAPTLVIGATHDRFIPFHHSEHLAKGIDGARLEAVESGHLCILESADTIATLLSGHVDANRRTT